MKRIISLLTAAVLTLALLVACAKPAAPLTASELLDLGEKYLLELDYEQAIVQFLAVIEVEPMNARAYIGAAEAYLALGRTDDAIALLERGFAATGDAAISAMLAALEAEKAAAAAALAAREAQAAGEAALSALAEKIIGIYETQGDAAVAAELRAESFRAEMAELSVVYGDQPMIHKTAEDYGCGFYRVGEALYVYIGQYADLARSGTGAWLRANEKSLAYYTFTGAWGNDAPNGEGKSQYISDMTTVERQEGHTYGFESHRSGNYEDGVATGSLNDKQYMEDGGVHNFDISVNDGVAVVIGHHEWDGTAYVAICTDCGATLGDGNSKYGVDGFVN